MATDEKIAWEVDQEAVYAHANKSIPRTWIMRKPAYVLPQRLLVNVLIQGRYNFIHPVKKKKKKKKKAFIVY